MGECGLSRSRRFRGCRRQGSRMHLGVSTGGAGHVYHDERTDGFLPTWILPGGGWAVFSHPLYPWQGYGRRYGVHREMCSIPHGHWQYAATRERRFEREGFQCATGMDWARGTYGSKCAVPNERVPGHSARAGRSPDAGHGPRMLSGVCPLPRIVLRNPVRRSCRGFCLMAVSHIETVTRALLHNGNSPWRKQVP